MRRLLFATLLVSAAALAYELLLMRTLSIVQWHHFAYMIISLALLGYGASGTFIALFRTALEPRVETVFAMSALLCSVTMVLCFIVGQRVPFNALEIVWNPWQFGWLCVLYVAFFVPFFFAATCIGVALTFRRPAISRIYFFDLVGAGLGALLVMASLFYLVPQDTLLAVMTLPLIASVIVTGSAAARLAVRAGQVAWLLVLATGLLQEHLDLRVSAYKGLSQALTVVDSRVEYTSSSPLGLISVVRSPTVPVRHAPGLSFGTRHVPPEQLAVFTDADNMTALTRFDGSRDSVAFLADLPSALPYAVLDQPVVLVLGAGVGSDVLMALHHDAQSIDAVELNPQVTELVTATYADFVGRLYDEPRVSVFTDEARGFVARRAARYDLVQIGLLDSFGAAGAGVQSLNESYLYTIEALAAYLKRTRPGGFVAITRWLRIPPRDNLKLIATAIAALQDMGIADPGARIVAMRSWATTTLLIKNGVLRGDEVSALREFARARSFDMAWYPGMPPDNANRFNVLDSPYLFEGTAALLGDDPDAFIESYKFHIAPATDDRPHFFHFFKWRTLPEALSLRLTGGAGLIDWGYLVLAATLIQALAAGAVLILVPLLTVQRDWPDGTGRRMGTYFLLLGLAFLFVEIAFIQRFILFLSHPLYSVAVVLCGFLVFAGIGSAATGPLTRRLERRGVPLLLVATAAIGILSLTYVLLLPAVFERLADLPDVARILVSLGLIAPLAIAMGMPFPLGLKRLAGEAPAFIPWAWGVNGFASVAGAVLAALLAVEFGFSFVIAAAVFLYAAAAWLASHPR